MIRAFTLAMALGAALPLSAEEPAPRPVVSEIISGAAERLRAYPGVVGAEVETLLGFQTTGQIETRPVHLGDRVTAGEVLATLDQISLAQDVAAAEAALRSAEASAEYAAQSLARAQELSRRGVASAAVLEAVQARNSAAVAAAHAAQAQLARARDAASFGTLTAPAPGVVTAVLAEPGTVVTPGTPVVRLATEAGREAVIDVPEATAALLAPGERFIIEPRIEGGRAVPGELRLIEPVADASTRARRLRIRLLGAGAHMRLGTLVSARLDRPDMALLTVPVQALMLTPEGAQVWRVGAERRAELVTVQLGATLEGRVIVTSGLSEGDEVLVRGIASVRAGESLGPRVAP